MMLHKMYFWTQVKSFTPRDKSTAAAFTTTTLRAQDFDIRWGAKLVHLCSTPTPQKPISIT
jgi:hypothetical protein